MNDKERCRMLIDEVRMLRVENAKLLEDEFEIRKTCIIFDKENAELKKELNEVGRKWLNDFSRQDTLITELEARWEELKEVIEEEEKLTSKLHDDFNTGSRAAYGVVLDMMGELSHKLLEQKKVK